MNFQAKAKGKTGELWLYDQIGQDFFGEGVSAKAFKDALNSLGRPDNIDLHIHSPGGDVFDGMAIYDMLCRHPAKINVVIDGLCASIASVIAMCGETRQMAKNGRLMIHNPQGFTYGDETAHQRVSALLASTKSDIIRAYASKTGMSTDKLSAAMDEETWFTADQAMENGFVTQAMEPMKLAASFKLMTTFKNMPAALRASGSQTPLRDLATVQIHKQAERVRLAFANSTTSSNNAR